MFFLPSPAGRRERRLWLGKVFIGWPGCCAQQFVGEILSATDAQGFKNILAGFGLMEKEQCFLQPFLFGSAGDMNRLATERVFSGVINARRQTARRWGEVLDLFNFELMAFEIQGDLEHILQGAARVTADQVRDNRLPQSEFMAALAKPVKKFGKDLHSRFAHDFGHLIHHGFRRNLEQPADMVTH